MSKKFLFKISGGLTLGLLLSSFAIAQDTTMTTTTTTTKKEVVQNADGSYTVIEYPVGKEVTVNLTPIAIENAKGTARIMRSTDGTKVYLDLNNVTGDTKTYYAYALDPAGVPTYLGPLTIENGIAKSEFSTPMSKFSVVISPNEGVTTFGTDVPVTFRSIAPTGAAVTPVATTNMSGTKQVATSTDVSSTYQVPLLNVPSFTGDTTEIRVNFDGELKGLKGKAYVKPRKDGTTQVKMRFDDMKMAPKDSRYILWASSADGKYTKLGQVINTGERQESEIRGETALKDFGLFVTMEKADVPQPTSTVYTTLTYTPAR